MPCSRWRFGAAWSFILGLCCVCAQALAQPASSRILVDTGVGYEVQTSPLFQISPDSTVQYQDGTQSLRGTHATLNLQASADWVWSEGISTSLAANAVVKRSVDAPGLEFNSLGLMPSIHRPVGAWSLGLAGNFQVLDIAGQRFRDVQGAQFNLTQANDDGMWGMVLDLASYTHPGPLADLDAQAASLVLIRQINRPFAGVDGLDFSAIVGRERNVHDYADLSQRSAMFSTAVRWSAWGAQWSLGHSWRHAQFDDTLFAGEVPRADRTDMTDISAQWPLNDTLSMRVEVNDVRNHSTTHLYDNVYQQLSVSLQAVF